MKSNPMDLNKRTPLVEDEASGVLGAEGAPALVEAEGAPAIARRLFDLVVVLFIGGCGGRLQAFAPELEEPDLPT